VREIALGAAKGVPRVLDEPKTVCDLIKFGDSSLDFCLRFWIRDPGNGIANVRGAVMLNLWDAFKREGVEIPYPVRDVRMTQVAAPKPKKRTTTKR
jgi:small-conductance mechanosensitive channel